MSGDVRARRGSSHSPSGERARPKSWRAARRPRVAPACTGAAQRNCVPMDTKNPNRRKTFATRGVGDAERAVTRKKPSDASRSFAASAAWINRTSCGLRRASLHAREPPPSGAKHRAGSARNALACCLAARRNRRPLCRARHERHLAAGRSIQSCAEDVTSDVPCRRGRATRGVERARAVATAGLLRTTRHLFGEPGTARKTVRNRHALRATSDHPTRRLLLDSVHIARELPPT